MVKLSLEDRVRVIVYFEQGVSQRRIAGQLCCNYTAVQKVVRKFQRDGTVKEQAKSGLPHKLTPRQRRIPVGLCKKDCFRPATVIRNDLETSYGFSVSV